MCYCDVICWVTAILCWFMYQALVLCNALQFNPLLPKYLDLNSQFSILNSPNSPKSVGRIDSLTNLNPNKRSPVNFSIVYHKQLAINWKEKFVFDRLLGLKGLSYMFVESKVLNFPGLISFALAFVFSPNFILGTPWEMTLIDGYLSRNKNGYIYGYSSRVYLVPELKVGTWHHLVVSLPSYRAFCWYRPLRHTPCWKTKQYNLSPLGN